MIRQEDVIAILVIGFLILIGIFLLLRELMCWYYKINRRIKLQEETVRLLKIIAGETKPINQEGKINIVDLKSLNLAKEKGEITQDEYLALMKKM